MRIAIVSSASSIHVNKLANALVNKDNEIVIYTLSNHTKLADRFDSRIKIVKLPFKSPLGYYLNVPILTMMLKKEKYDLINSHYASGYGTLSRLTGIHPLSLAVFGSDVFEYPYKSKRNMRNLIKNLQNADVITSTSHIMVEEIKKYYKANNEIFVTPFGVNVNQFYPLDIDRKKDIFEFGIVKKIEKIYGIDILIRAFKMFLDDYPNAKAILSIYGRGSATDELIKLSEELEISDRVFFKGFINNEDVPKAFSTMSVACFPSVVDESFGVAIVEAMACGVPVIASDVAGFREVMINGSTGILVEKKSIHSLKKAMEKMYNMSVEDRNKFGEEGRKRVLEKFDFNRNMETYIDAISKAVV